MSDAKRGCQAMVTDSTGWHYYHCSRNAMEGSDFCKQHSPEAVAARSEASRKRYIEKRKREDLREESRAIHLLRSLGYTVTAPEGREEP